MPIKPNIASETPSEKEENVLVGTTSTYFHVVRLLEVNLIVTTLTLTLVASFCPGYHIDTNSFIRNSNASDFSLGSRRPTEWIEKLRTDVVEFVPGWVVGNVIRSFDEMVEIAAGVFQNFVQRWEALADFA
jgi:hypothetical protein